MLKARLFVATVSFVSLTLQPVAYGQNQQNFAATGLKKFVNQNQKSGKPVTVKEFWEKNKSKLHPEWQKSFYPSVELLRDERIPEMEVISVKGPNGQDTARLVIALPNKKTISIEMLGGTEKFVRINNQVLSYNEFYNGEAFMQKMVQDPVVKLEGQRLRNLTLKKSIVPSTKIFAKFTPFERAQYFLNLRLLVESAQAVQEEALEKANKEQASTAPSFIDLLLEEAYAQQGSVPPSAWVGNPCVVAGNVGKYIREGNRTFCDYRSSVANFQSTASRIGKSDSNTAKSVAGGSCPASQVRCNPFVYGFERSGGQSLCVPVGRSADYQQATRTCNVRSPLKTPADTQAMIESLLKKEGKNAAEYFENGLMKESKVAELNEGVIKEFDVFIEDALMVCRTQGNIADKTNFGEKFQSDACNVLNERKMAFEAGVAILRGRHETPPTPGPIAPGPGCVPETAPTAPPPPTAPVVTPCPPVTAPPVAQREGDNCEREEANGSQSRGRWQGGVCVAVVPAVAVIDQCNVWSGMQEGVAQDGSRFCGGVADRIRSPAAAGERTRRSDNLFGACGIICPLAVFGIVAGGIWHLTKSKQKNTPVDHVPAAPPPGLPNVPPQPTMPVPVPALPKPPAITGTEGGSGSGTTGTPGSTR